MYHDKLNKEIQISLYPDRYTVNPEHSRTIQQDSSNIADAGNR